MGSGLISPSIFALFTSGWSSGSIGGACGVCGGIDICVKEIQSLVNTNYCSNAPATVALCPFVVERFLQRSILFMCLTFTKSYQAPYDRPAACVLVAFATLVVVRLDASASVA